MINIFTLQIIFIVVYLVSTLTWVYNWSRHGKKDWGELLLIIAMIYVMWQIGFSGTGSISQPFGPTET